MSELIRKLQDQHLHDSMARMVLTGSITLLGAFLLSRFIPGHSSQLLIEAQSGSTSFWKGFSVLTSQYWLALSILLLGFADYLNRDRLHHKISPFFFLGLGIGFSVGSLGVISVFQMALQPSFLWGLFALLILSMFFGRHSSKLFSILFLIAGAILGNTQGSSLALDLYPSMFAFGLCLGYFAFFLSGFTLPRLLRYSLQAVVDS